MNDVIPLPSNPPRKGFSVSRPKGAAATEIIVFDEIGKNAWTGSGIASKDFRDAVKAAKTPELHVRINSPGGDVFEAVAMLAALKNFKGTVTAYVDGLAASAASVLAMGASEIVMADGSFMMIHNPYSMVVGGVEELRRMAELLDKVKDDIIRSYRRHSKLSIDEIDKLMSDETWMSAAEAVEKGFATRADGALKIAAYADPAKFKFKNIPTYVVAKIDAQQHAWDETQKRLTSVKGLLARADRDARKQQRERDEHNRRIAALDKILQEPEYLLSRRPASLHEAGHALIDVMSGGDLAFIEAREDGSGVEQACDISPLTKWQRICALVAGCATDYRSINETFNVVGSLRPGSDADQLLPLVDEYLGIDPQFKLTPDVRDLIVSRELELIGAEVKSYLREHRGLLEEVALIIAKADNGRIDDTSDPSIAEVMDLIESRAKPFPKHPTSVAVCESRAKAMSANLRMAEREKEERPTTFERVLAEYNAEHQHVGRVLTDHRHRQLQELLLDMN